MWADAAVTAASTSTAASASAILRRDVRPPIRGITLLAARPMRYRLLSASQRGLGGGHTGDRHPVRRAAHVIEPGQLEERDRVGIAPVLATDAELEVGL